MNFANDLCVFPSAVHKLVYFSARSLTPLDVSLAGINDEDFLSSCRDFYAFLLDMLSDMYDNPEMYRLPAYELEQFLQGKKINGMKQRFPRKAKECISLMRNAVNGYMNLLCQIGQKGKLVNDRIEFTEEDLKKIKENVKIPKSPISFDERMQGLSRVGMCYSNRVIILNKHKLLGKALMKMAKVTNNKTSGFPFFLFCNADFRVLNKNFKPNYTDYYQPLVREKKQVVNEIHEMMVSHYCRPTVSTFWKVDYKYKGAQVLCLSTENGDINVRIVGTYNWDDSSLLESRLQRLIPDMQKYALRHIWRCNACSTSHLGVTLSVLGRRQRVCGAGLRGFQWINPALEEIGKISEFVAVRSEIIDEIKNKQS